MDVTVRGYTLRMSTHSTEQARLAGPTGPADPEAGVPSPALLASGTSPVPPAADPADAATGMAVPAPELPGTGELTVLQDLHARAAGYATRARGPGTLRTYRSAWRAWEAWCTGLGRAPLAGKSRLLAMYAVYCADRGLSVSSLRVHLAAILAGHRLAGVALEASDPRLAMVVEGIVRSRGTRPRR